MKDMTTIDVKALSSNRAWQGRRFKTPEYKAYEEEFLYKLPPLKIPEGRIEMHYLFGLSSKLNDVDNCIKSFQDVLQKKYGFDDRRIFRIIAEKIEVNKGQEFITFSFLPYSSTITDD